MIEELATPTNLTRWPFWRPIGIVNVASGDGTTRTTAGIIVQAGTARLRSLAAIGDMTPRDTSTGDYLGYLNVIGLNQCME